MQGFCVWNAYHCAYFPPFTSFSAFPFPLVSRFACRLSDLKLLWRKRGVNQRRQEVCCFAVSVLYNFWFSLSHILPFLFCFLGTHVSCFDVLKLRWNLSVCFLHCRGFCLCPIIVVVFIPHSVQTQLSLSSLCFLLSSLLLDLLFFCFIGHHIVVIVSVLPRLLSLIFLVSRSLFSPFGLFSFSVPRLKDHLSCCLHSESFSSGSLPHAATLTAWVKRSDLLRIANVLWGNELNYAHCRGEDIHNTGIKLLKVTQYLALQLPAVYRKRGMFRQTDMHMSHACAGPDTDWGRTSLLLARTPGKIQDDGLMTAK